MRSGGFSHFTGAFFSLYRKMWVGTFFLTWDTRQALVQEGCIGWHCLPPAGSTGQGQHRAACCRQHLTCRSVCRVLCIHLLHLLWFKAVSAVRRKSLGTLYFVGMTHWVLVTLNIHTSEYKATPSPTPWTCGSLHSQGLCHSRLQSCQ